MADDDDRNDERGDDEGTDDAQRVVRLTEGRIAAARVGTPPPWMPYGPGGPRRCSFCDRREDAVRYLVRARGASICDQCIELAGETVAAASPGRRLLRFRPQLERPADRDAAEEAITDAFETAIGGDAPIDERLERIEGGAGLEAALEQVGQRLPPGQRPDLFVETIRFLGESERRFVSSSSSPDRAALGSPIPDTRC